jgi:hypothetical protein
LQADAAFSKRTHYYHIFNLSEATARSWTGSSLAAFNAPTARSLCIPLWLLQSLAVFSPLRFDLSQSDLEASYKALQKSLHPDRFHGVAQVSRSLDYTAKHVRGCA